MSLDLEPRNHALENPETPNPKTLNTKPWLSLKLRNPKTLKRKRHPHRPRSPEAPEQVLGLLEDSASGLGPFCVGCR